MKADAALDALADRYGIIPEFRDLSGATQQTSPETKRALLRASGIAADTDAGLVEALAEARETSPPREVIVPSGAGYLPDGDWRLLLEDGTEAEGRGTIPALPSGLHVLQVDDETIHLIAAPDTCPSVEKATGRTRVWGVNAPLYGLRSGDNGGFGNFRDLGRAAEALAGHGAAFIGINPVHAIGWTDRETRSPYSPTHRGFLDYAHVAMDGLGPGPEGEFADRLAFLRDHRDRLETMFATFSGDDRFDSFRTNGGDELTAFARHEALTEQHGADWRSWPQDPGPAPADRVRFHMWLQWRADMQLRAAQERARRAGMAFGLYLDLAVGARRYGAESRCGGDAVARGVSLGAPPDHLGPDGQNWQLMAYAPRKLAERRYAPWRQVVRRAMRHAGILRIDHVLGLARSYWIPDDGSPGGYVRQPMDTFLALLAIEAERTGTVIIGEDLGLVPDGLRAALAARGLYGCSVLQYERDGEGRLRDPRASRRDALLAFGTHDTPTMRGFRQGRDIDWWRRLGWIDADGEARARARRATDIGALDGFGDVHAAMAASPAAMLSVQMDDLSGEVEAQNLPGTVDGHPNWQRRCRVPVEGMRDDPVLRETGTIMDSNGRGR